MQELAAVLPDWKDAESTGIFAENFFPDQSVSHRKSETDKVFAETGKILSSSEFHAENQLRGYFILTGEKGKAKVHFTLSPEHEALVQQLTISFIR